jgi:DNA-binding NarL/FixJ family response regulator
MDGFAAFAALRKTRPEVRVVLCSGFSEPERAQALITTGARGVLPKPFSYAQFQDTIERAMGDQAAPS